MGEVIPELPVIDLPEKVGMDNSNPSGRVIYTQSPQTLPANCAVCHCHADGEKYFIDFGFFIEYYGQVYFCEDCLTPVAEACDYIPADEFRKVANILAIALDRGRALEKDNERLRGLLDGLLGYKPADEHKLPFDEQVKLEANSDADGSDEQSVESDSESGHGDVFEAPSNDDEPGGISL